MFFYCLQSISHIFWCVVIKLHSSIITQLPWCVFVYSFMAATDANSSELSVLATPLKAIENVCSLNDVGHCLSSDQPATFAQPQLTSTPAGQRTWPRNVAPRVLPLFGAASGGLRPGAMSRVVDAGACLSGDGGFLPESQTSIGPNVIDLTADEVTCSQFRPTVFSTQSSDGPGARSGRAPELPSRIGDFDNSFALPAAVAWHTFRAPAAIGTQQDSAVRIAGNFHSLGFHSSQVNLLCILSPSSLAFYHCIPFLNLQCFDAVGWVAGRASGL